MLGILRGAVTAWSPPPWRGAERLRDAFHGFGDARSRVAPSAATAHYPRCPPEEKRENVHFALVDKTGSQRVRGKIKTVLLAASKIEFGDLLGPPGSARRDLVFDPYPHDVRPRDARFSWEPTAFACREIKGSGGRFPTLRSPRCAGIKRWRRGRIAARQRKLWLSLARSCLGRSPCIPARW